MSQNTEQFDAGAAAGARHEPVVGWFDISAGDAAATRSFYGDLFGWTITPLDDSYALVGEPEGPAGGVGQAGDGAPYTGLVVYFAVPDVGAALDRATELGASVVLPAVEVPGRGRIAVFTDPEGNKVGLTGA